MTPTPAAAVATFCRRVAAGAFLGGFLQAALVAGVVLVAVQLGLRLCGGYLTPSPWWAALAAPVIGFGVFRMRRQACQPAAAAAHLDRRLGLHGLLLCAHEGLPLEATFRARLAERLAGLKAALPQPRWRQLLPLPMLAVAFAVGVALLPPPPAAAPRTQSAAVALELEKLAETMRDLFARGEVPDEVRQELQQKLRELQQRAEAGEMPEWRDLDHLDQRLEREQLLQAAADPAGKQGVPDLPGTEGKPTEPPTAGQLAAAAKALDTAGLLEKLPAELAQALQRARQADGSFSADALPQDAEALARLAKAMAAAAGQLGEAGGDRLGAGQLAELKDLLERFGGARGAQPTPVPGGEGGGEDGQEGDRPGRGGVSRGPGHAALSMSEDAQGGADAALALPPGYALPGEWVPVGTSRIEPEVNPERSTAPGGAGAAGAGGASWQLELAPRHRAVLQRFFGAGTGTPGKDGR